MIAASAKAGGEHYVWLVIECLVPVHHGGVAATVVVACAPAQQSEGTAWPHEGIRRPELACVGEVGSAVAAVANETEETGRGSYNLHSRRRKREQGIWWKNPLTCEPPHRG
jgi:hypothetical protein